MEAGQGAERKKTARALPPDHHPNVCRSPTQTKAVIPLPQASATIRSAEKPNPVTPQHPRELHDKSLDAFWNVAARLRIMVRPVAHVCFILLAYVGMRDADSSDRYAIRGRQGTCNTRSPTCRGVFANAVRLLSDDESPVVLLAAI